MNLNEPVPEHGPESADLNAAAAAETGAALQMALPDWLRQGHRPPHKGYLAVLQASCGHALQTLMRRRRLALAALVAFLPVLIPIALSFLSNSQFAEPGNRVFVRLAEELYVNVFTPLMALFFAGMLVAEDIEMRTMTYILTRPTSRSGWVFGRFLAFMVVASVILICSCALTFAACTMHADFSLTSPADLKLLAHYCGVMILALLAYGSFCVFLGAFTKRPIVYGVILLYGWQYVATLVPGLVDFFTIKKYTDALLPIMATQRNVTDIQTALGTFQREVLLVGAGKALIVLLVITAVALGATVVAVSRREYAADRAAGG